MSRSHTPAAPFTSFTFLFIFFLLFTSFCVNVKANYLTLHQDIIGPDSIDSVIDSSSGIDYGSEEDKSIVTVDQTPKPVGNVMGVLYSISDACSTSNENIPLLSTIPQKLNSTRIAIFSLSDTCSILQQILNVQKSGAICAIVYKVDGSTSENGQSNVSPTDITIPAVTINANIFNALTKKLNDTTQQTSKFVRVVVSSSQGGFNGGWKVAIIVIGCLLAVSFLVSVLIHCRLYQLRRRERNIMVARHESESIGSSISAASSTTTKVSEKSSSKNAPTIEYANDVCAICLEEFNDGELLRRLPLCSHEYHKECIDSTPPEVIAKREKKFDQAMQVHARLNSIYDTSNNRHESSRFSTISNDNNGGGTGSSKYGRFLDWFGYGNTDPRDVNPHVRPNGNLFAIQDLPQVVVRSESSTRMV
ncbi:11598_t:CDS:2 [Diversispora eburnea]|uniref:11598_t:CDS:1 n=1 Tax=Diversispora eburnea TaxID=1213867 RepID=A0A9N9FAN7_9GLOM|nr:11598_t:CDS:2 [Diversispora eburnea]